MSTFTIPTERGPVKMREHCKIRKSLDELALIYRVLYGRPSQTDREKVTLQEATYYAYGSTFDKFLANNADRVQVYEAPHE